MSYKLVKGTDILNIPGTFFYCKRVPSGIIIPLGEVEEIRSPPPLEPGKAGVVGVRTPYATVKFAMATCDIYVNPPDVDSNDDGNNVGGTISVWTNAATRADGLGSVFIGILCIAKTKGGRRRVKKSKKHMRSRVKRRRSHKTKKSA